MEGGKRERATSKVSERERERRGLTVGFRGGR